MRQCSVFSVQSAGVFRVSGFEFRVFRLRRSHCSHYSHYSHLCAVGQLRRVECMGAMGGMGIMGPMPPETRNPKLETRNSKLRTLNTDYCLLSPRISSSAFAQAPPIAQSVLPLPR